MIIVRVATGEITYLEEANISLHMKHILASLGRSWRALDRETTIGMPNSCLVH